MATGIIGVYCILNSINGKRYIGKSIDIKRRWRQHKLTFRNPEDKCENCYLHRAVSKYGLENFEFYIVYEIEAPTVDEHIDEELSFAEELYIRLYNSSDVNFGYNLTTYSYGKIIISESTREKFRQRRWTKEQKHRRSLMVRERLLDENYALWWKNKINKAAEEFRSDKSKFYKSIQKRVDGLDKYAVYLYNKDCGNFVRRYPSVQSLLDTEQTLNYQTVYKTGVQGSPGFGRSYKGYKILCVLETKDSEKFYRKNYYFLSHFLQQSDKKEFYDFYVYDLDTLQFIGIYYSVYEIVENFPERSMKRKSIIDCFSKTGGRYKGFQMYRVEKKDRFDPINNPHFKVIQTGDLHED